MVLGPIKLGGFALNETLTSSQANTMNTEIQQALDGAAGGAYTLTAELQIAGEGISNTELANIAALKAINTTSVSDGAHRYVAGLGRYRLDKSIGPTDAEDQPMVVAPTVGTGRWFAEDARACKQYVVTFTAGGTWTCPRNLALAMIDLWGGGGGGGGGANTSSATDDAPGGAGGGAGQRVLAVVSPTPTTVYTAHVGAGGGGGAGGGLPLNGSDGAQSYLGALIAANGGQGGSAYGASAGAVLLPGGASANAGEVNSPVQVTGLTRWPVPAGHGGYGRNGVQSGRDGGSGALGAAGGSGGPAGTTSTNKGGSGGGGGGSGPGGVGGTGGTGGNGTGGAAGAPQNGTNGTAAAANSGAGGGGGGGAGAAASGTGAGGSGLAGGSGQIVIRGFALATGVA